MSLAKNNTLKTKLESINVELSTYSILDRDSLYTTFIKDKLRATLQLYNSDIDLTSDYLLRQQSVRVLKALTKITKQKDKQIIEEHMRKED